MKVMFNTVTVTTEFSLVSTIPTIDLALYNFINTIKTSLRPRNLTLIGDWDSVTEANEFFNNYLSIELNKCEQLLRSFAHETPNVTILNPKFPQPKTTDTFTESIENTHDAATEIDPINATMGEIVSPNTKGKSVNSGSKTNNRTLVDMNDAYKAFDYQLHFPSLAKKIYQILIYATEEYTRAY